MHYCETEKKTINELTIDRKINFKKRKKNIMPSKEYLPLSLVNGDNITVSIGNFLKLIRNEGN